MRKRFRWGDVQDIINRYSAPKIEKLRRRCEHLMALMPDDAKLKRLNLRAFTYFRMYKLVFRLEFDLDREDWVLNLAKDPRRPTRRPLPARVRAARRLSARPIRPRRGRKALKSVLAIWGLEAGYYAAGLFSPIFARTVSVMKATLDSSFCLRGDAYSGAANQFGAQLEPRLFGANTGMPLLLNTFAPIAPLIDWDSWLFGAPEPLAEAAPR